MSIRPHTINCAASFRARSRNEQGISLVEVLIAILVLAVVSGGVGMAVTGAARQTVSASASKAQLAAATQVFESVKSHRDWMTSCAAAFHSSPTATCDLKSIAGGISSTTAATLMKAPWLGNKCAGGPFSFRLLSAVAVPRDSADDKLGAADIDGITPDYYRIQISVDTAAACDVARLGTRHPSVLDSAVDQHGRVPTASLTVDVCSVQNQMDERMDLGGCTGGTIPQMQQCAALSVSFAGNPEVGCKAAWNYGVWGDAHFATASDVSSSYVNVVPRNLSFTLVGPAGSRSSASATLHPRTGEYVFNNLPVGNYTIKSLGLAANEWLWWSKAVPSADTGSNEIDLSLQPDTFNRALIPIRPNRPGVIDIVFKRRVSFLAYSGIHDTGEMHAGNEHIPTSTFYGDVSALYASLAALNNAMIHEGPDGGYITDEHAWVSGNCLYGTYVMHLKDTGEVVPKSSTTCSWYKLHVRYKYYRSDGIVSQPIFNGATDRAAYMMTPAPTFRDEVIGAGGTCANPPAPGPPPPPMSQLINAACVPAPVRNGRDGPVRKITLSSLSAGLNTGITQLSLGSFTAHGQTLSGANNDDFGEKLPAGGLWVQRSGAIQGPGHNYGVHPTIKLVGKGECYWNGPGARNVLGSCIPCNPYIAPLGGWFGSCYVLVSGTWMKDVYFTGDETVLFTDPPPTPWTSSNTGIKECYGVPAAGDENMSAPNCHAVSTPTPSGGGASNIPLTRHIVYAGSVGVEARHTRVASS